MSRSVPWRHTVSDVVHWRQLQAIQARIYVLQENGPTAFTLKEHDSAKKLRVTLGDPSACTCTTFLKERELCIHILWVILKLFRIPPENPISWQGSLVEREIQQMIKSREKTRRHVQQSTSDKTSDKPAVQNNENCVEPRPVEEGDCCPICQDEMTPAQHLTFCRYSCGHSIHSKCMKIWADHQLSQGTKILCPMCRAEFGTLKMIMTDHLKKSAFRRDTHPGTTCNNCNSNPIQGKHYMCTICQQYSLCMQCFAGSNHTQHPFQFKEKPAHRWRPAVRDLSAIPPNLAAELENREITENDYETLLELDSTQPNGSGGLSAKELASLKCIMLTKHSSLLKQRELYCHICLASYSISQHIVELPCTHKFHKVCADNWLAHTHDYCPTCTEPVVVTVPERKKTTIIRYNRKDVIPEQVKVDFSLAGSAMQSNGMTSGSMDSLHSSGSSRSAFSIEQDHAVRNENEMFNPSTNPPAGKNVLKGRRAKPLKSSLPKFAPPDKETPDLTLGSGTIPLTSAKPTGSRKSRPSKPPQAPRDRSKETVVVDLGLRIGTAGGSPVDIIKRISSVHERPGTKTSTRDIRRARRPSRERTRSRSPSVGPDIQPDLVVVSGTRIS